MSTSPDPTASIRADSKFGSTYRLSNLAAANQAAVTVAPDDKVLAAMTIMMTHDFSQLPVVSGKQQIKGIITWRSIAERLALRNVPPSDTLVVRDYMEKTVHTLPADTSVFSAIGRIIKREYAVVLATDGSIRGVVTTTDLSNEFRDRTEPFLLVGEIENHIRQLIEKAEFATDDLKGAGDPRVGAEIQTAADMNMGEYLSLLNQKENWTRLRLTLDRKIVLQMLDDVRRIRNKVMHFTDQLKSDELEKLRHCREFFDRIGQIC